MRQVIVIVAMFAMKKNPTMNTLMKSDQVHEEHDDHRSASGTEECLVMFFLFHSTMCLYSGCSLAFTVSLPPR